ncbi:MAG: helix-turn-helix domain-containing protein [Ruminococcus sp.]|nr:helix-turn-helix domain-containing protein [Ruminococcus sp.]
MTFWETFYNLCESHGTKPNAVAKKLGFSTAVCTLWKNGSIPSGERLLLIANYFNVSTDYLLGNTQHVDDDLKFALFNGADGITDEMFEEVKAFAEFVRNREETKRKG